MESKVCSRCKFELNVTEFNKNKSVRDGYGCYCKSCRAIKRKELRETNGEKANIRTQRWREKNPDKYISGNKKYIEQNLEKVKNTQKNYRKNNKDKVRNRKSIYQNNKIATDNLFKLKENIRKSILISIRRSGFKKTSKTANILGCSFEEFKIYIESKWQPWMNWDNHGKYNGELNYGWDIDHIIPSSSAKSEEEIVKLNHYTNLQPLCSKINRDIKRDNY